MEFLKTIEQKNSKRHQNLNRKRYRSAFTTDQINYLEKEFQKCAYIDVESRKQLANIVKIPERAIKIWFQNRRMKEKKCTEKESDQSNTFVNDPLINLSNIKLVNDLHYRDLEISTASPNCHLLELLSHTRNNLNSNRVKMNSSTLPTNKETDKTPKQVDNKLVTQHSYEKLHNYQSLHNNYDKASKFNNVNYAINTSNNNPSSPRMRAKESLLPIKRKLYDSLGIQGLRQNKRKYIKQEASINGDISINTNRKHHDLMSNNTRQNTSRTIQNHSLKANIDFKKPVLSHDPDFKDGMNIKQTNMNCNCICNCCRLRSHCESKDFHIPYMLIVPTCSLGKNIN